MIFGVDVSRWQPAVDWALLKNAGVEFVIIKASQGDYAADDKFAEHAMGAKAAGMIVGAYHWCDPLVKYERQAQFFLDVIAGSGVHLVAADAEQYWADWQEWAWNSITKYLSQQAVSDNAKNILAYWQDRIKLPAVLYSRASFIQSFARPMLSWAGRYPLWMAHYPYNTVRITCDWETFKAQHLPKIAGPNLPQGCKAWKFWQFTGDKFNLPGMYGDTKRTKPSAADVNYFNGTLGELRSFCGLDAAPADPVKPAPATLDERVTKIETVARGKGWEV